MAEQMLVELRDQRGKLNNRRLPIAEKFRPCYTGTVKENVSLGFRRGPKRGIGARQPPGRPGPGR